MNVVTYSIGEKFPVKGKLKERGMYIHFNEFSFDVIITGCNQEELSLLRARDFKYGLFEHTIPFFVLQLGETIFKSAPFNIQQMGKERGNAWLVEKIELANFCFLDAMGNLEETLPFTINSQFQKYLNEELSTVLFRYRNKGEVDAFADLIQDYWTPEQMFEYVFPYQPTGAVL